MVYAIPTYELRSTPAFGRRRRLPPAAAAMLVISRMFKNTNYQYFNNEHSGGCKRQASSPAEGGRRAKLVCRYRVYHLSEAIKLKTRRPPTGFLVLQSHHSHTCKILGPVPSPHMHFSTGIHFNISMLFSACNYTFYHQQGELFSYLLNIFVL